MALISKNDESRAWLQNLSEHHPKLDIELLANAMDLSALSDKNAPSDPLRRLCLSQNLALADILIGLQLDSATIAASLVYAAVCYADLDLVDVQTQLGEEVGALIAGIQQMGTLSTFAMQSRSGQRIGMNQVDRLRRMILAMVADVRVVIIKLAERLCLLQHMDELEVGLQKQTAQDAIDVHAPLANRLGVGQLKSQIEDAAFRYVEPEDYASLIQSLAMHEIDRRAYTDKMLAMLREVLQDAGIQPIEIQGRAKHLYSIHLKMQRKQVDFDEIYDAIALRVIVDDVDACYQCIAVVHALWTPVTKEFDDYIATPKSNGYRSIHTAVIGPQGRSIEIQVRTQQMHEFAEYGVAAHWAYKEKADASEAQTDKLAILHRLIDWHEEMGTQHIEFDRLRAQLFGDRVYVFTPRGEVKDLPKGATPLDFAYQVHTEVGHRCRGAKVNGRIVTLSYTLKTGETVEILTAKEPKPIAGWMDPDSGYLKTARARAKVQQWFRHQMEVGIGIASGSKEVQEKSKSAPVDVDVPTVHLPVSKFRGVESHSKEVVVEGIEHMLSHLARCCEPMVGDPIVGYVTQSRGVSIHQRDCASFLSASERQPGRVMQVNWGADSKAVYEVALTVTAVDRAGLIRDVSHVVATAEMSLLGLNSKVDVHSGVARLDLEILVHDWVAFDAVVGKLSGLQNVISVQRVH